MSGSIGLNLLPVNSGVSPKEGSKCCVVNIKWQFTFQQTPYGYYPINLLQQYQSGQFSAVQAVFIDNGTCPYQVTIQNTETGQTINCPAFSQGMFNILSSQAPAFIAQLHYVQDNQRGTTLTNCTT